MFCSVALVAGSAFNLWWILRRTFRRVEDQLYLLLLVNTLLFSLVQAENWFGGLQLSVFLTNYLVTLGVCIATSRLSLRTKLLLTAPLAFIAMFSFGNGLLLWVVTFPISLYVTEQRSKRAILLWLLLWFCLATATMCLYFWHYVKPAYHPPLAASHHLLDYYRYVAGFLGAPLSNIAPLSLGTLLLAIYLAALLYTLFWKAERATLAPWLALGGFALLSAGMAAITRIGFGVSQALESRYTTFGVLMSVSIVAVIATVGKVMNERERPNPRLLNPFLRFEGACLILLAIAFATSSIWGLRAAKALQRQRLLGKGALLFGNVLNTHVYTTVLLGPGSDTLPYANMLDRIGLLHPSLMKSAKVADLKSYPRGNAPFGWIDSIVASPGLWSAQGWAVLPLKSRASDCVLLAVEKGSAGAVLFAVSEGISSRPDVARDLHEPELLQSGWSIHFDRSALPAGPLKISAFGLDAESGVLYELNGSKSVD
jgi:hypothetical protein